MNKRISFDFKFRCHGNSNENNYPSFKTKDDCFLTIRRVCHSFFLIEDTTCNSNQTVLQKAPGILHFHFFIVLQHCVCDVIFK